MKLKLVEPLRELFKDEVRRWAGLACRGFVGVILFRAGLAIRIPGEITEEKLEILRKATSSIWTRSARPVSTTRSGRPLPCCCGQDRGRDGRCADVRPCLRAARRHSSDGMTADYYPFGTASWRAPRPASSMRCAASTG